MQLKTNRKSNVVYQMAPVRVTFSDLEGHLCCLKLCVHPPRWFTSMMVRWQWHGDVNNIGGSRRWLITVTVQLTSPRLVVRKSVDNTHDGTTLRARCAIVVRCLVQRCMYKTMQVAE